MDRIFNISADCKPNQHYMVNIEKKLEEIKKMVDRGDYFTINRARQYGKTTTLRALGRFLKRDYIVISMDFQRMGASKFRNENTFSLSFAKMLVQSMEYGYSKLNETAAEAVTALKQAQRDDKEELELFELFGYIQDICRTAPKPIVLMIDEVDNATNNEVFLDFLAQLRACYIDRDESPAFWSVILAGVYDIKNMKLKIRPEYDHKMNSPWNIAVDFLVDMSFSEKDIAGMLAEYERDYQTGMDVAKIAGMIYEYTSGYPFLVSCICKLMDERLGINEGYRNRADVWTSKGVLEAVRILLAEQNTLFESLIHKLEDYPELKEMLHELLFRGKEINYVVGVRSIEIALMLGFVKKKDYKIVPANRIFETLLYNWFLASPMMQRDHIYDAIILNHERGIWSG